MPSHSRQNEYTVLALSRRQGHHFEPLKSDPRIRLVETDKWDPCFIADFQPDLLLTLCSDWFEANYCLETARSLFVPSVYLMDGIIEWKHQWENPKYGNGGGVLYNQPINADKISCMGWESVRLLESWGNIGKCELVGLPRLDPYLSMSRSAIKSRATPKRLLILTANTPGFTELQIHQIEQSLKDLRESVEKSTHWTPVWRVTKGLDSRLGLVDDFPELRGMPLFSVLTKVDAVISTPSTAIVEAMLAGLPTAVLNYDNVPQYIRTAWSITSQTQIEPVLDGLMTPSASRMAFQEESLHNILECYSPATPRLAALICTMAMIGRECRKRKAPIILPTRILDIELGGTAVPSVRFDYAELYPNHPVFANKDMHALQVELTFARQEIGELRRRIAKLESRGLFASAVRRILKR